MTEHTSLAAALAAFQAEAPTLYKSEEAKAGSFTYKYVDLAAVVEAVRPLMGEHGLSFSSFPCITPDGKPGLRYVLRHVGGDVESDVMSLMLSKADAQAHGSAITYARRYALCAVLNLVADADDDGAAARAATERAAATTADQERLADAAKGLTAAKIKLAFTAIGLTPPETIDGQVFAGVPREKTAALHAALAGAPR